MSQGPKFLTESCSHLPYAWIFQKYLPRLSTQFEESNRFFMRENALWNVPRFKVFHGIMPLFATRSNIPRVFTAAKCAVWRTQFGFYLRKCAVNCLKVQAFEGIMLSFAACSNILRVLPQLNKQIDETYLVFNWENALWNVSRFKVFDGILPLFTACSYIPRVLSAATWAVWGK